MWCRWNFLLRFHLIWYLKILLDDIIAFKFRKSNSFYNYLASLNCETNVHLNIFLAQKDFVFPHVRYVIVKVHFRPHNNFPAQSLHFRFGSVVPCPTLKSDVATSIPRTRYRQLVRPYLIGFSYCMIISLPKLAEFLPLARGNQLSWFRSSHLAYILPLMGYKFSIFKYFLLISRH